MYQHPGCLAHSKSLGTGLVRGFRAHPVSRFRCLARFYARGPLIISIVNECIQRMYCGMAGEVRGSLRLHIRFQRGKVSVDLQRAVSHDSYGWGRLLSLFCFIVLASKSLSVRAGSGGVSLESCSGSIVPGETYGVVGLNT